MSFNSRCSMNLADTLTPGTAVDRNDLGPGKQRSTPHGERRATVARYMGAIATTPRESQSR